MFIASLSDLKPIHYKEAFPQTSFPDSGPPDSFLSENGYAKVSVSKPHNSLQKLEQTEPYFENGFVYTVRVVDKTEEEIESEKSKLYEEKSNVIRLERNRLLSESDWTQLADVNLSNKEQWLIYRQELRDITEQSNFPDNVTWPEKPS